MRTILIMFLLVSAVSENFSQTNTIIKGVDLSFAPQIEELGGKYKVNGESRDILDIVKENGVNYVRLRLWHTPSGGFSGLEKTLLYAKKIKSKGINLLLDFHYSDSWADPGRQTKPSAWANLSFELLKDSVYRYTKNVITSLKNQNSLPDMVQIGNEITGGMLWPDGKLYGAGLESEQWIKFGQLVKQGIKGVKDAAGSSQIKIMIHIDRGGDNKGSIYFYDRLLAQGVEFDVIGLSYYPWWHGTLSELEFNINDLANRYNKEINIVETAYPWTLNWKDYTNNIVGLNNQLLPNYPATVQGQYDFIKYIITIITNISGKKGNGFFYWAPDWISLNQLGSSWENMTFFDFNGEVLNSISAFNINSSLKEDDRELPIYFKLFQNYPNPFNPESIIQFSISEESRITLSVYNSLGQKIDDIIDGIKNIGIHKVKWNAGNHSSGVYFYKITAAPLNKKTSITHTRKMILIK